MYLFERFVLDIFLHLSHVFLMSIPLLPADCIWSAEVYNAVQTLHTIHGNAVHALTEGGLETHWIVFHQQRIARTIPDLLQGLYDVSETEGLPEAWVQNCIIVFTSLIQQLQGAKLVTQGLYVFNFAVIADQVLSFL